ncbi:MAG TPA: hypothetical protein VHA35_03365 [Dongiaceae bacterium]|jgi:hypothetical protein|nr:hypothetical protein [Dongiaceae bacterium]
MPDLDRHGAPEPRVWLLEPDAAPEDSWWQGRPIWQLAVAAPTAAFARLEAERWARRRQRWTHIGNESSSMNAGFIDQRLYRARELREGEGLRREDFGNSPVLVLAGPMASLASA